MTRVAMAASAFGPLVSVVLLALLVRGFDEVLVTAAAMVTSIGMVALYGLAGATGPNQAFYAEMVTRHGLFIGAGSAAMVVGAMAAKRVEVVARFPYSTLVAALALTATTIILGETVNGARLWLQLGPVRFQPSEVARLLLVTFIAAYIYERRFLVAAPWRVGALDLPPAPYLAPLAGAVLAAAGVLVFQNDLGMATLVALGAFATVAGVLRSRGSVIIAAAVLVLAAVAGYSSVPRVRDRVAGWLNPWADPLGRGFQFVQADFGLASSGLLGTGDGAAAARVPEVHTDFILVGVASQFGLLGAAAVIGLIGIVVVRCVINALRAPHGFGALLASGLAGLFAIQVVLIVGGTLRVLPLTGLTFPLLSYGGTSMVTTLFALGLIVGLGARSSNERAPVALPGR